MSGIAQKGNIAKANTAKTNGYDSLSERPVILATYNSGEVIGTFQGFHKNSAGTTFAKVKLNKPVSNGWFGWEVFGKTYTDAFFLLSDVSIFSNTNLDSTTKTLQRAACTANGVRLRTNATLASEIITTFNQGDIIGVSDFVADNDFIKIGLAVFVEKDGKTHGFGYMHKDYVKPAEQADIEVADGSTGNSVNDVTAALPRQDGTPANGYYNRYASSILWGLGIVFTLALGIWYKRKNKKNGQTKVTLQR